MPKENLKVQKRCLMNGNKDQDLFELNNAQAAYNAEQNMKVF